MFQFHAQNPASRDRRSPLQNQMFIAEEPILVNNFFSIVRPYGMYEAMYQTRAHLRPRVKPRIAPYKTRQTLPGCRAPLNANEEEHEGLWAARKSANHRCNLRRQRNRVLLAARDARKRRRLRRTIATI